MDSIRGSEPWDPGSIPGVSTIWGYGVMDSTIFCGVVSPGSNPGAPTTHIGGIR